MPRNHAERRYSPSSVVARKARQFVAGVMTGSEQDDDTKETVDVLTSEIVSDAMRHDPTNLAVRVDVSDDVVRGEVDDESDLIPDTKSARLQRRIGRRLVDRLSRRWGTEADRDHTTTWFEVDSSER